MPENYRFLQELVQTSSPSGHEGPILDVIENHFQTLGIESFRQGPNVLVHIEGKNRDKALILDGHVDTVTTVQEAWTECPPAGNESGIIQEGRLYGAGSSDMKAGLAVMERVLRASQRLVPACDIWGAFVVEEETTGKGTESFLNWFNEQNAPKYKEMGVLFPESTGVDNMYIGQKGNAIVDMEIMGDGGHASRHTGINVISRMAHFFSELEAEGIKWSKLYDDDLFGPPTFTPTVIQSGQIESPNAVSPIGRGSIDVRLNPAMYQDFFQLMKEVAELHGIDLSLRWGAAPAVASDPKGDLTRLFADIAQLKPQIMASTSDAGWFLNNGFDQVVINGPGNPKVIHLPNEYVQLDHVNIITERYLEIIDIWGSI